MTRAIFPRVRGDGKVPMEGWYFKGWRRRGKRSREKTRQRRRAGRCWRRGVSEGGWLAGRGRPINMAAGEGVAEARRDVSGGGWEVVDGVRYRYALSTAILSRLCDLELFPTSSEEKAGWPSLYIA